MKFLKIGKRILIGVTLLATGLFVAYRIGTYHQNIIEYNNVLVKDIVKSELESAIQTVDDVDVGLNVKDINNKVEVQDLSSPTEKNESGEVKVAVATTHTSEVSKTSSNKSSSSSNKVISSKNNSATNKTSNNSNKNNSSSSNNKTTTTISNKNPSSTTSSNDSNKNTSSSSSNSSNSNSSSSSTIEADIDGTYRDDISSQLSDLINIYRESLEIQKLTYDSSLQSYADTRAKEIAVKFSHTRPNGQYAVGGNKYKSEIIASGNSSRATLVVNSWKKSSAHNSIMIDSQYTKFAISSFCVGNKYYYVVIFS